MSPVTSSASASADSSAIGKALLELVSRIPTSEEPGSPDPEARARAIARMAAIKSAGISGALAIPPGPLGLATILPDLLAIWRLQQAMVADIAAAFGKSAFLQKEAMVYCLFRHGGAALMRDLVTRVGERYLIRRAALEAIQQVLQKMGVRVSQRVIGKSISRWLPVVGAVGVGAYAYYDTTQVAANAIELFSKDLELEGAGMGIGAAAPSEDRDQTPEDGGQRSDVGGQRSEVGRQTSEGGGWKEG